MKNKSADSESTQIYIFEGTNIHIEELRSTGGRASTNL